MAPREREPHRRPVHMFLVGYADGAIDQLLDRSRDAERPLQRGQDGTVPGPHDEAAEGVLVDPVVIAVRHPDRHRGPSCPRPAPQPFDRARLVPTPGAGEQPFTLLLRQPQPGFLAECRLEDGRGSAVQGPPQRRTPVRKLPVRIGPAVHQCFGDRRVVGRDGRAQDRQSPFGVRRVRIRPLVQQVPHGVGVTRQGRRDQPAIEFASRHVPSVRKIPGPDK